MWMFHDCVEELTGMLYIFNKVRHSGPVSSNDVFERQVEATAASDTQRNSDDVSTQRSLSEPGVKNTGTPFSEYQYTARQVSSGTGGNTALLLGNYLGQLQSDF